MENLNRLTKVELIERLEDLQSEYDDLEQQYDDLDELYGELETGTDDRIEELEKELESIQDIKAEKYDYLLRDITTNTDLQNQIHEIFRDYYLAITDLYCIDIPYEVIKQENNKIDPGINKDLIKVFENYIEDLILEEDIVNI